MNVIVLVVIVILIVVAVMFLSTGKLNLANIIGSDNCKILGIQLPFCAKTINIPSTGSDECPSICTQNVCTRRC